MTELPADLQAVIAGGPLCHLTTLNEDGSPQVTVVWLGMEDGRPVTAHLPRHRKVRNMERDPRVVLSFLAPPEPGAFLQPYVVLQARATVTPREDAWDVLDRLAKVYLGPDQDFPAPRSPGYVISYDVEKIGGVGSWAA